MKLIPKSLLLGTFLAVSIPARERTDFKFFNAGGTLEFPDRISKTGLYRDIGKKIVAPGIFGFEVNTPLWSDAAAKLRYVILPNDSVMTYRDSADYRFPIGTVFVKSFMMDTVLEDPDSRIYLETRFLIKIREISESGPEWTGVTYVWDKDQQDASLVPEEGLSISLPIHKPGETGAASIKKWRFPSRQECLRCHMPKARQILGFFTAQLNRSLAGDKTRNQLQSFADSGLFAGNSFPDFTQSFAWAPLTDSTKTLEHRARSYFGSNCSSCHSPEAYAHTPVSPAKHDFNYFHPEVPAGYINKPANFRVSGQEFMLIAGGNTQKSFILLRMSVRDPLLQMPPIATTETDTVAVRVVSDWIRSLPIPEGISARPTIRQLHPIIRNGEISLPWVSGMGNIRLFDLQGKPISLVPLGGGIYRPARALGGGVYLLRIGTQSWSLAVP